MEINNRLKILIQAAQVVQSKGALSLDDAVVVKTSIDNIVKNENVINSVEVLIKTAEIGQSKGCFSLEDAYVIYLSINGLIEELSKPQQEETKQKEETETKKGEE